MTNTFSIYDAGKNSPADRLARIVEGQAKIVRGSAYPEQTAEEIIGTQGHFDSWFERNNGISPNRAKQVLFEIFNLHQEFPKKYMEQVYERGYELVEEWKRIKKVRPKHRTNAENTFLSMFGKRDLAFGFGFTEARSNLSYNHYPVDLKNLPNIMPALTDIEIEGLINLIGMTVDKRKVLTEIIEVRQNPLYVLSDRRVIVVDPPSALDALWEALDSAARTDSSFWDGKYAARKGDWLEDKSLEHLEKYFPKALFSKVCLIQI